MSYKPIVRFECGCFGTRPATNGDTFLVWPCSSDEGKAFSYQNNKGTEWKEASMPELATVSRGFDNIWQANKDLTTIVHILQRNSYR